LGSAKHQPGLETERRAGNGVRRNGASAAFANGVTACEPSPRACRITRPDTPLADRRSIREIKRGTCS